MTCETTHEAGHFPREVFLYWLDKWAEEWEWQVFGEEDEDDLAVPRMDS